MPIPSAGDVVVLGPAASVQFIAAKVVLRVIRMMEGRTETWDGWRWIEGYQLDDAGDAVEKRELYVNVNGVEIVGFTDDTREPALKRIRTRKASAPPAQGPTGRAARSA